MNEGTGWYVEEKRAYGDPRLTACDDLLAAAGREEVASIVGFVRDAEAAALNESLREAVGGEAVVYCAQNYYCPGAVGADVVACGDHLNDLGLFAAATHSIAPANAHPTVLASATVVVGSNDEDGGRAAPARTLSRLRIGDHGDSPLLFRIKGPVRFGRRSSY